MSALKAQALLTLRLALAQATIIALGLIACLALPSCAGRQPPVTPEDFGTEFPLTIEPFCTVTFEGQTQRWTAVIQCREGYDLAAAELIGSVLDCKDGRHARRDLQVLCDPDFLATNAAIILTAEQWQRLAQAIAERYHP